MPKIIQNGIVYSGISSPYFQEVSATLLLGETSITIYDECIKSDSTVEVFVAPEFSTVMYSSCIISDGNVVLTFPAQLSNMPIKLRIWLKGNANYLYPIKEAPTLPTEYQRVEYLDIQGAYFTVTIPTYAYWKLDVSTSVSSSTSGQGIFGYRLSSSNTQDWYFDITDSLTQIYLWSRAGFNVATIYNPKNIEINTKYTVSGVLNTSRTSAYIGAYYITTSSTTQFDKYEFYGKLYSLVGYAPDQDSNYVMSVVSEFVPCYRKSDSQVGLYETVSGTFYTPTLLTVTDMTTSITAGPDVN